MSSAIEARTERGEDGDALMPRPVRRGVIAAVALLLAAAVYLFAVRGTALLFDLAHMTAGLLCL